jgi:hypothetical protein
MKLYGIRTNDGKIVKDVGFFITKVEAKKSRDELNEGTTAELAKKEKNPKFFVTYGPDHFRYEE